MAEEDVAALVASIDGIAATITTVGLAVIGVVVVYVTFRWARRAIGL
ncbi:MAG TPA: hypothetical protein DDY29_07000 [Rhodobacteraceae bacterium]|jgi:hypothetical protein|nr:hypothetical protein [Paracoccaceae bacterium]